MKLIKFVIVLSMIITILPHYITSSNCINGLTWTYDPLKPTIHPNVECKKICTNKKCRETCPGTVLGFCSETDSHGAETWKCSCIN